MDSNPGAHPEFWLLLSIAVVYAFAEGTFSSWAVIFVRESRGFSPVTATSALSAFLLPASSVGADPPIAWSSGCGLRSR